MRGLGYYINLGAAIKQESIVHKHTNKHLCYSNCKMLHTILAQREDS